MPDHKPLKVSTYCHALDAYLMDESVIVYSHRTQQVYGYEKADAALFLQIDELLHTHSKEEVHGMFAYVREDVLEAMLSLAACVERDGLLEYEAAMPMGHFEADALPRVLYVVDGLGFAVHYPEIAMFEALHPVFEHLVSTDEGVRTKVSIDLVRSAESWKVIWNGLDTEMPVSQARLATYLQEKMMTAVYQSKPYLIALHAAAVENGGSVVIMPATAESGKTTLTASLLHHGLRLFSDEVTVLDADGGVQPLPFCMNIKEGSQPLLVAKYPHLADRDTHSRFDGQPIRFLPPIQLHEGRRKASHIVFVKYTPGVRTLLSPLNSTQALARIKEASFQLQDSLDPNKFRQIIEELLALPKYALEYSDIDEAMAMIDDLCLQGSKRSDDGS